MNRRILLIESEGGSQVAGEKSTGGRGWLPVINLMWKLLPCLLAAFLASCSGVSYDRQWKAAQSRASSVSSPEGCWEGTWKSDVNGHEGKLRCIVTSKDAARSDYEFHYHATWAKFLTGTFSVICHADRQKDATWKVSGSKDLGAIFGGVFHHEATISPVKLQAKYSATLDRGRMELSRVQALSENATKSASR